jgi:LAO/AO transport system kinase
VTAQEWVQKIQRGDTTTLARAITLLESHKLSDWDLGKEILNQLPPPKQPTFRLGFSGPPGVGKSTFLESLGLLLLQQGARVAVLAIDPSSEISGGSILGDKTRMERLSREAEAFVRPSATRGHLGGVTASLPGVIRLCEAAGYQWVLVESVGVGQSEIELSRMVDLFTLITQPGAGDELQGIKKGILEYADVIVVNKVDRDAALVNTTIQQYHAALKIMRGSQVPVFAAAGLTGQGVAEVLQEYKKRFKDYDFKRRQPMEVHWFFSLLQSEFKKRLRQPGRAQQVLQQLRADVEQGHCSPIDGVDQFFQQMGWS